MAKVFEAIIRLSFFASYPQRNGYNLLCIEFFGKANYDKIYLALKKLAEKYHTFLKRYKVRKQLSIEWKQKWRDINQSRLVFIVYIRYGAGYHKDDY